MTRPLKLRAIDAEDIQVVAACLQDAIVPLSEICYRPSEQRFVLLANRFKWEGIDGAAEAADGPSVDIEDAPFERTNCAVTIDGVVRVRRRNIDLHNRSLQLCLLTILATDDGLMMVFSEGACIHLQVENWTCRIEDVGDPWPTYNCPDHALNIADGRARAEPVLLAAEG